MTWGREVIFHYSFSKCNHPHINNILRGQEKLVKKGLHGRKGTMQYNKCWYFFFCFWLFMFHCNCFENKSTVMISFVYMCCKILFYTGIFDLVSPNEWNFETIPYLYFPLKPYFQGNHSAMSICNSMPTRCVYWIYEVMCWWPWGCGPGGY